MRFRDSSTVLLIYRQSWSHKILAICLCRHDSKDLRRVTASKSLACLTHSTVSRGLGCVALHIARTVSFFKNVSHRSWIIGHISSVICLHIVILIQNVNLRPEYVLSIISCNSPTDASTLPLIFSLFVNCNLQVFLNLFKRVFFLAVYHMNVLFKYVYK